VAVYELDGDWIGLSRILDSAFPAELVTIGELFWTIAPVAVLEVYEVQHGDGQIEHGHPSFGLPLAVSDYRLAGAADPIPLALLPEHLLVRLRQLLEADLAERHLRVRVRTACVALMAHL